MEVNQDFTAQRTERALPSVKLPRRLTPRNDQEAKEMFSDAIEKLADDFEEFVRRRAAGRAPAETGA